MRRCRPVLGLGVAVAMAALALPSQSPSISGACKAAAIDDPRAVPLAAETTVLAPPRGPRASPAALRLHEIVSPSCSAADNGRLMFRVAADKPGTILAGSKPHVVSVATTLGPKKVLLYRKGEHWYASSATTLKCTAKEEVEFLDADLDGEFVGAHDFVRHNGSAFRPVDDAKLLLMNDVFGEYALNTTANPARLSIRTIPWPDWTTNEQRYGAFVIAGCRQIGGLPPLTLHEERSRVCSLHANYLFLNKYSFETSITKTHAQDPSLPGYTKEGAAAAREVVMTFSGDMLEAITAQIFAMLHRTAFLGPTEPGLGIALKLGSQVAGVPGYTVFWGTDVPQDHAGLPIVFPAPGSHGTATFCAREAPNIEDDPSFYNTQRGLAVSVTYGALKVSNIRMSLFADDKKKPIPIAGRVFSHEKPISRSSHPENNRTAFFVADKMLPTLTWFTAVFEADLEGSTDPIRLQWSFETQK
jgi:hypothetical protein